MNFGLAQIACILANVNRDTKEHPQPIALEKFLLQPDPFGEESKQKKRQDDRYMKTTFGQMAKALDKRKGK